MSSYSKQLDLFAKEKLPKVNNAEWGTFKDSLRAPIHGWFTYPAGFSYKAVAASLQTHQVVTEQTIYDPFMGTGTTNLTAKKLGLNSYGVEAHPFVFRVARAKLHWDLDQIELTRALREMESHLKKSRASVNGDGPQILSDAFPELVLKCYEVHTLLDLLSLRQTIADGLFTPALTDFLFIGLTALLRQVSRAETGWPYIAPKKLKTSGLNKDVWREFTRQIHGMAEELATTKYEAADNYQTTQHRIFNTDSRDTQGLIPAASVDHVFTSPPYLNNFDYADRTRLELYFWGEAKTWGDITKNIRTRLITSATTQIARNEAKYALTPELRRASPQVYEFLSQALTQLGQLRLVKGGKKSYDYMVSGYFNDLLRVLSDTFRVLKPKTKAIFVLGDSAPYGVHIPTDELIGKLGVALGFADYKIDILRTRGDKWKSNPQRHHVALRESIVTLSKN